MDPKTAESVRKGLGRTFSYGGSLVVVGGLAYADQKGFGGDVLRDIWANAKTASPFAAMLCLLLLWDQIKERREAQKQCNDRTIDFIRSVNNGWRAVDKMADAVEKRKASR